MNPQHLHALVLDRQAELYQDAAVRRTAPRAGSSAGLRERIGMLLVETGLHLITRADGPVVSSQIAR